MLPFDAGYETDIGAGRRDLQDEQANIAYDRAQTEQHYGFNDPSASPFSVAALMQRDYDQTRGSTLNKAAAGGQLYSGSTSNQRGYDRFNYERGRNEQLQAYEQRMRELTLRGTAAEREFADVTARASAERLGRAVEQPPDPSLAPPGPGEEWLAGPTGPAPLVGKGGGGKKGGKKKAGGKKKVSARQKKKRRK